MKIRFLVACSRCNAQQDVTYNDGKNVPVAYPQDQFMINYPCKDCNASNTIRFHIFVDEISSQWQPNRKDGL